MVDARRLQYPLCGKIFRARHQLHHERCMPLLCCRGGLEWQGGAANIVVPPVRMAGRHAWRVPDMEFYSRAPTHAADSGKARDGFPPLTVLA